LSKGIFSRVAKQLSVSIPSVTRVANGERRSQKITAALVAELQRIEAELEESESAA
jgi:hypothetical protein